MTKQYFPFDNAQVMEAQWSLMAKQWVQSGVFPGLMNELLVYGDSTGMQVKVKTGGGWVQGHYYSNDMEETLAIQAAHATLNRIDRIILYVDWTNNICGTGVVTGTPGASPAAPALTQNTSIWQISLAQVYAGAAVSTISAGNVTDERSFAVNSAADNLQINNSGGALVVGNVVVRDLSVLAGFKTTTKIADPSICGILTGSVASGQKARLQKKGYWGVWTTGAVVPGHWLVTSATAGIAQDSGSFQRPLGGIGIALVGSAGGLALTMTDVDIIVYTPFSGLQRLPSSFNYQGGVASATHNFNFMIDPGADLTLLRVMILGSAALSAALINGLTLTSLTEVGAGVRVAFWYLKNPPSGIANVSLTLGASTGAVVRADSFLGSQSTPFRTPASNVTTGVSTSVSPASAVGDLVVDGFSVALATSWLAGMGAGQANDYSMDNAYSSRSINTSIKAGIASNTPMSWSGSSGSFAHLAVAIAGS